MRARTWALVIATGAVMGAGSCIVGGTFVCDQHDDCQGRDGIGTCEVDGWCSFPDPTCTSGARYSRWAGDGLARDCVQPDVAGTDSTGPGSETTGPPADRDSDGPECGNGITEVGEDCDDQNAIDGDGCNTCVSSGTRQFRTVLQSTGDDFGHDVAVADSGHAYVAAQQAGQNGNAWIQRLDPDGGREWSEFYGGGPPDAALGLTIAEDLPDGEDVIERVLFVVGYQTPSDDPDDMNPPELANQHVKRYDELGGGPDQDWSATTRSPQDGDDRMTDVAHSPALGEIVVFGHMRGDLPDFDADATVQAFPTGTSNDRWLFTNGVSAATDDFATAGVVDDEGRIWAVGRQVADGGDVDAWICHLAIAGDPPVATREWTAFVDATARDDAFEDVALGLDDDLLAVGRKGPRGWLTAWPRATANGPTEPLWAIEPAMPGDGALFGIAIDGTGAIVVVGSVATADHGTDAWVQKLRPDLSELWHHQIDGAAHGDDIARGVAIGPADRVLVVGDALERVDVAQDPDGTDRDVWIEAYAP